MARKQALYPNEVNSSINGVSCVGVYMHIPDYFVGDEKPTAKEITKLVYNTFSGVECVVSSYDLARDEYCVQLKDKQPHKIKKDELNNIRWFVTGVLETLRSF